MLKIKCPYCGDRDETEFSYGGEAHIERPDSPSEVSDEAWGAYLFGRPNKKGLMRERWFHVHGCRRWFNLLRDTSNHTIIGSYTALQKPSIAELKKESRKGSAK